MASSLERVTAMGVALQHAQLLLDRLNAMEESGALTQPAKAEVGPWMDRLDSSLKSVPPEEAAEENPSA
jgi:hypothetical protein